MSLRTESKRTRTSRQIDYIHRKNPSTITYFEYIFFYFMRIMNTTGNVRFHKTQLLDALLMNACNEVARPPRGQLRMYVNKIINAAYAFVLLL